MPFPVLLQACTIDATNNVLRISEAGVTRTATLATGVYYLRGDAGSDDLLLAIKTAMEAAGPSANTYNIGVEFDTALGQPTATVYVSIATGTDAFALLFANVSNTFPAAFLGFADADTASDTSVKSGSLSPQIAWVGSDFITSVEPVVEQESYATVALSGRVRAAANGSSRELVDLELSLQAGERTHKIYNTSDIEACFASFWARWAAGAATELYDYDVDTGTKVTSVDTADRLGAYHLDSESATSFRPARLSLATTLYSWRLLLREAV